MSSDPIDERLAQLWAEYAAALPGDAEERFQADVFRPCLQGDVTTAVAAWVANWQDPPDTKSCSPSEIRRLRDSLGDLLEQLETASTRSRWFAREPHPLATAETKALLTDIYHAFDGLTHQPSANATPLGDIARAVNDLLATAPPTWPAAAALIVPRLQILLERNPSEGESLKPIVQRICSAIDPSALAVEFLDALAGLAVGPVAKLPVERANWLDLVLENFRGWAAIRDVRIVPITWSYVAPPAVDELAAQGVSVAAVYRADEPLGQIIRLKCFGIVRQEQQLRPAIVTVSAGVAPVGLAELEELLAEPLQPAVAELAERVREWRTASLQGRLESAAVELYVLYWDRFRDGHAEFSERLAGFVGDSQPDFGERLAGFLAENFGLAAFYPATFQERPAGWIQPLDGTRMTTGRVRDVLRPGLVDRGGELRVPARASVE